MTSGAPPLSSDLRTVAARAAQWMVEDAAPLWSRRGRTASGLFAERISLTGEADPSYFRSFVQARHIFSFVEIGRLGWDGPWEALIAETMETLLERGRRPDGLFVHRFSADAFVLDGRADLYDQAFLMLALAKAGEALGRPALFDVAENLMETLDALWSHPLGGYHEGEIADRSVRRQNPHMHLLEAFLALHDASGRAIFLDKAVTMANLCAAHFIDPLSGALLEYFQHDWRPAPGILGRVTEPGHCFEWAWLVDKLVGHGWPDGEKISDGLCRFARQYGISARHGAAINEVLTQGEINDGAARLWPQTERLKAAVARYRRYQKTEEAEEILAAAGCLTRYLAVDMAGFWRDRLTAEGDWTIEPAPGSSLYHICCAYAELVPLRG